MTEPHEQPRESGADTAGGAAAATPRLSGSTRTRVLFGLASLCVLLAAVGVFLGLQLRTYANAQDARTDALRAARQSAINLTSIESAKLDEAVSRVLDGATGEFRKEFQDNSGNLKDLLSKNEVSAEGRVIESGLVRSDKSNASALVVVDSTVKNVASPEGRVNTYRMQIEVERVDGRWLTSSLRFVG
jgi:Mce-associated membrane protein